MCYLCKESRTAKYRATQRIIADALRRWPRFVGPAWARESQWKPSWGDSHDWTKPPVRPRTAPRKLPYSPGVPKGPRTNRFWTCGAGLELPEVAELRLRGWLESLPLNRELSAPPCGGGEA
jgi:hypothetical protein